MEEQLEYRKIYKLSPKDQAQNAQRRKDVTYESRDFETKKEEKEVQREKEDE